MLINLVVALYAVNLWLRDRESASFASELGLSALGIVLLLISGWLGGEMAHVHAVGVAVEPAPLPEPAAVARGAEDHASATTAGPT